VQGACALASALVAPSLAGSFVDLGQNAVGHTMDWGLAQTIGTKLAVGWRQQPAHYCVTAVEAGAQRRGITPAAQASSCTRWPRSDDGPITPQELNAPVNRRVLASWPDAELTVRRNFNTAPVQDSQIILTVKLTFGSKKRCPDFYLVKVEEEPGGGANQRHGALSEESRSCRAMPNSSPPGPRTGTAA